MRTITEYIIGRKGSQNIKQSLRNGDVAETRQGTYSIYIPDKDVFWSGLKIMRGKYTIVSNLLDGWDESLIALKNREALQRLPIKSPNQW